MKIWKLWVSIMFKFGDDNLTIGANDFRLYWRRMTPVPNVMANTVPQPATSQVQTRSHAPIA